MLSFCNVLELAKTNKEVEGEVNKIIEIIEGIAAKFGDSAVDVYEVK